MVVQNLKIRIDEHFSDKKWFSRKKSEFWAPQAAENFGILRNLLFEMRLEWGAISRDRWTNFDEIMSNSTCLDATFSDQFATDAKKHLMVGHSSFLKPERHIIDIRTVLVIALTAFR